MANNSEEGQGCRASDDDDDMHLCSNFCHLCATSLSVHRSSSFYYESLHVIASLAIIKCTICCVEGMCCSAFPLQLFRAVLVLVSCCARVQFLVKLIS
jgi:hypothetical protein